MTQPAAPAYAPLFPYLAARQNAGLLAEGELVIDNFAGIGGASAGMEAALGRPVDHAINHDPVAVSLHRVNHPHSHHSIEDVWQVDPREVTKGQPVALAWFSPDCFPAGTLVLSERGYVPIETVRVGERVLTHELRWKRVTETSSAQRPLLTLRGYGHPGLAVSPEHPFLARPEKHGKGVWTPASVLGKGHYWATPTNFGIKCLHAPPIGGRGLRLDEHLFWLAGQYLSNGWTRLTEDRAELVITTHKGKADGLREQLDHWARKGARSGADELAWHGRETETAYQFSTNHRGLVEWLREHFGHRAEGKTLPGWAYQLPAHEREALLRGYLQGDGSSSETAQECSTVSKALAFSLKSLAESLGKSVTVFLSSNPDTIQGRAVNTLPIYQVRWRHQLKREHTVRHQGIEWTPIREVTAPEGLHTVYNIGVEDDESYVVEGIIVHNCKHFSKAKGAPLVEKKIRGLAWVAVRWAALARPRVIILENVEEFQTWGPLILDPERPGQGVPDPARKGRTFNSFVNALRNYGYTVEWRELRACDYGTPTIRKRLFLIARRDGLPIVWPEPTHAAPSDPRVKAGLLKPYATAASCIDWSLPTPSIFDRKKPLVRNTLNRIAQGLRRFVLEAEKPFIVTCNHGGAGFRGQDIDEPFRTVMAAHEAHGLTMPDLAPVMVNKQHSNPARPLSAPLSTVTTNHNKNELVAGQLLTYYGPKRVGETRGQDGTEPLRTQTTENRHAVLAAHLTKFNTGSTGQAVTEPIATVVAGGTPARESTGNTHGLVAAHLTKFRKDSPGQGAGQPLDTISAGGEHFGVVASCIVQHNGGGLAPEHAGYSTDEPARTVLASGGPQALTTAHLTAYYSRNGDGDHGQPVTEPLRTIPTVDRFGPVATTCVTSLDAAQLARARQVAAFLAEYLTPEQLAPYLRDGLILLTLRGELYVLVDIGMRMLTPRELARCQGFPEDYELEEDAEGHAISKARQVRGIGNSVCPQLAEVLTRAQLSAVMSEAAD